MPFSLRSAIALLFVSHVLAAQEARPSIVAIMTDDQGQWAVGAYGNKEIRTPNMDRLAAEGALFTDAIAACPVCSPARGIYFSGLHPTELGFTDWISPSEAREGLGLSARTWPQVLQKSGYRTALIGKWHLGDRERFHPTKLGFDHFMGFLAGGNRPMDPVLEIDGKRKKLKGPLPDLLTNDALRFIKENKGRPFALCLHYRAPHLPYGPVPAVDRKPYEGLDPSIPGFRGLDRKKVKESTRRYYASISSVDRNIGRVLALLEELGLVENTLVLFTSDHGYNEGRHGVNTKGNGQWIVGGRTGPKRPNMWDTSIRVPLIVRWPARVKKGMRITRCVSSIDTYRTVLGALGVSVPKGTRARGEDFSPLLFGREMPARAPIFGQYDLHNYGLAYLRMVRTRRFKYIKHFHARGMDELYDLLADPGEKRNLMRSVGRKKGLRRQLEKLQAELQGFLEEVQDPILKDRY